MKKFSVRLVFSNLDNSLYTDQAATMTVSIEADDVGHALLLARRLQKVMDADHIHVNEVSEKQTSDDSSWVTNPDRMGGQFTEEEIRRAGEWR